MAMVMLTVKMLEKLIVVLVSMVLQVLIVTMLLVLLISTAMLTAMEETLYMCVGIDDVYKDGHGKWSTK